MNIKAIFLATILGVTTYNQANAAHHIHPCTVEWQMINDSISMKLTELDENILSGKFIGSKPQIHRLIKPLKFHNKWRSIATLLEDVLYQTRVSDRMALQEAVSSIYEIDNFSDRILSKKFSYDFADRIVFSIKKSYEHEPEISLELLDLHKKSPYTFYALPDTQYYSNALYNSNHKWDRVLTLYNHVYQIGLEILDDTIIEQIDTLVTTQLSKMRFTAENEESAALKLICALTDNDRKFSDIFIDICTQSHSFIELPPSIDILDMMIKRYRE